MSVQPSEEQLISQARLGDRRAFGRLVRMHQQRTYAVALKMLGNVGEAEDAVQETYLRAWRAIPRFDARSKLSTWLHRICINVCLNLIRKRRRAAAQDMEDPRVPEPRADEGTHGNDPLRTAENIESYRRLAGALDALSPSLRSTVILVLIEGVTHKDAAEALGCPEGTIAWRIHEARRKLKELLEQPAVQGRGTH